MMDTMSEKERQGPHTCSAAAEKGAWHVFAGLKDRRVWIETYGCRYNFGDSAKLFEILRRLGCTRAESEDDADAVIINTCTVVARTERDMLRRLSGVKNRNLYVTGCMPEVQREAILSVCDPVLFPPSSIQETYRAVGTVSPSPVGIVQIAQGCLGSCTYCIARKARGRLKSAPLGEIRDQVAAFAGLGSAEIQLTAQDAGAWGSDTGLTLADLLHGIRDFEGNFRVRVGMMNPDTVLRNLDEIVEAFASENLFRFIHVPVQSGSDHILMQMGRKYTAGDFENIVAAFRKRFPDITIMTDMIAGFPGESEGDFSESMDLLERLRFNKVNVTRYSARPGTPASSLPDTRGAVKKERSRRMLECAENIGREIHAGYLNRTVPFIVTEQVRDGSVMARTSSYTGIVLGENLACGSTGLVLVEKSGPYFLHGKRLSCP
jgi:MiaB/RimO family radical SAM methylthiotransferase